MQRYVTLTREQADRLVTVFDGGMVKLYARDIVEEMRRQVHDDQVGPLTRELEAAHEARRKAECDLRSHTWVADAVQKDLRAELEATKKQCEEWRLQAGGYRVRADSFLDAKRKAESVADGWFDSYGKEKRAKEAAEQLAESRLQEIQALQAQVAKAKGEGHSEAYAIIGNDLGELSKRYFDRSRESIEALRRVLR